MKKGSASMEGGSEKKKNSILIDMQAFVEERMKPMELKPERAKQKKELINEEERAQVRSACGALNWVGREVAQMVQLQHLC